MKILIIGDIVGKSGVSLVSTRLQKIKDSFNIDFCIANGENSADDGRGISEYAGKILFKSGVDVITMGNHILFEKGLMSLINEKFPIIRPANLVNESRGNGYIILEVKNTKVCIINLLGRAFTSNANCPFKTANGLINEIKDNTDIIIVDFHAETTSEKAALGWYLDGKISALFGTHTHVQTADEKILSKGTGFITDVGMTGPEDSIIGIEKKIIIRRFLNNGKDKFMVAEGKSQFNSIILEIDNNTGKTKKISRLNF